MENSKISVIKKILSRTPSVTNVTRKKKLAIVTPSHDGIQTNKILVITTLLITAALLLINYTSIDIIIQNHLFNFKDQSWLVDRDEPVKKFFFYKLPKILLGIAIVFCLVAALLGLKIYPFGIRKRGMSRALHCGEPHPVCRWDIRGEKSQFFYENRHRFFLIFLGLSLIPLIAGNIKKFTNIYCPTQLEIYGGDRPYVKIFDHYENGFYQEKKAKCFPAGHVVTGFALFILAFALRKKSHKLFAFFGTMIFGWILGFYQMAKGAHFFGDTLVSMLVCFFIAALLSRIYESRLARVSSKNNLLIGRAVNAHTP